MTIDNTEQIVTELKAGNRAAFQKLYDNYKQPFYRAALGICYNSDDAEDALQNCFLKIYRKIHTLKNPRVLESWMYRILINCAKSTLKSAHRKWSDLDDLDTKHEKSKDSQWTELMLGLQKIPLGYRNVFVLHAIQEIPQQEVAQILGVTVGTVKSQFHHARHRLMEVLTEMGVKYETQ
ncbi:MAG: RNA polymerase sigma factor [Candidatus Neomarinimicrobiota bacterium]